MAKLQDEDTDKVYYTNVACKLFDADKCQCTNYASRLSEVAECISLSIDRPHEFEWLPATCAYRLRYELKPLPHWHPLISGKPTSTHDAGCSVKNRTIKLENAGPLEYHLVEWD